MSSSIEALRKGDIDMLFGNCPDGLFEVALELGAGNGCQSLVLHRYCRKLLCTEYNKDRLKRRELPGVEYRVLDVTRDLDSLPRASFDLVFSSNLLEHLPDVGEILIALRSLLIPGGLALHCLPNPTWKTLQFALYPAMKVRALAWRLGPRAAKSSPARSIGNNPSAKPSIQRSRYLLDRFFPAHGQSGETLSEFRLFSRQHWRKVFLDAGYDLLGERELQFHSPYRFGCPKVLRQKLADLGLAGSTAYVLGPAGTSPSNARYFR